MWVKFMAEIREFNIDFYMTEDKEKNDFFNNILIKVLNHLKKNIDFNKIEGIILTGSLVNSEGTIIYYEDKILMSDFDLIIYFNTINYLKLKLWCSFLSNEITDLLNKENILTHVNYLPTTKYIDIFLKSSESYIYEYEYSHSSKVLYGNVQKFNNHIYPLKNDALELLFTVLSQQIYIKDKYSSVEKIYNYSKLSLTLINSFLIFNNKFGSTYKERLNIIKKYAEQNSDIITFNDIQLLTVYTNFKLNGSLNILKSSLGFENIDDLIIFQEKYLKNLSKKILTFELANVEPDNTVDNSSIYLNYIKYIKSLNFNLRNYLLALFFYIYYSFIFKNNKMKLYYKLFLFTRIPPKKILNYFIILLFLQKLHNKNRRNITLYFNVSDDDFLLELLHYWQISEKSIKF